MADLEAAPGGTVQTILQWPTPGLTGTLGARIEHTDSLGVTTITLARTTAGIVETLAGSGVYTVTLTVPGAAVLGDHILIVDDGSATPGHIAAERLLVTTNPNVSSAPSVGLLATLDDVKTVMDLIGEDHRDDLLTALLERASEVIAEDLRRECWPTNGAARTFTYTGGGFLDLAPYDLRTPTSVTVDGVTITRDTDYYCDPEPCDEGVYTSLEIGVTFDPPARPGRDPRAKVIVTGDWGFAAVPLAITQACIVTVQSWADRGAAELAVTDTETPRAMAARRFGGWAIPPAARRLLRKWRRDGGLA